jgi:hypothetical protein
VEFSRLARPGHDPRSNHVRQKLVATSPTQPASGCSITNNTVSGDDGEGGGVRNDEVMTISGCTISNNAVSGSFGEGGGVNSDNVITIGGGRLSCSAVAVVARAQESP